MAIFVEHRHYKHEGGTKDYDVWGIFDGSGKQCAFIKRWGKIGATGQFKRVDGKTDSYVHTCLRNANTEREKKGYTMTGSKRREVEDVDELVSEFGSLSYTEGTWIRDTYLPLKSSVTDDEGDDHEGYKPRPEPASSKHATWGTW